MVWERFGDVANYVEPFFGSGAVLLGRPTEPRLETVNDADCLLSNFWRALQNDPEGVASYADWPVNEADQHARHLWLCSQEDFRERMKTDPDYYDAKIAGWWVWGASCWIGSGWCAKQFPNVADPSHRTDRKRPHLAGGGTGNGVNRKLPHLSDSGTGIKRQTPSLGNSGHGINRQLPDLSNSEQRVDRQLPDLGSKGTEKGINRKNLELLDYMNALADRMRKVRVCCGDWSRVCGPSVTFRHGVTGVFLDPPYGDAAGRTSNLYSVDSGSVAKDVREWAIANGDNPDMRIAICGYEGEYEMPDSWESVEWKAQGGYGSQGDGIGRENSARERIWFSPHCLGSRQSFLSF